MYAVAQLLQQNVLPSRFATVDSSVMRVSQCAQRMPFTSSDEGCSTDASALSDRLSAVPKAHAIREIAAYVRFLCSDDASAITRSVQTISAGWTAR